MRIYPRGQRGTLWVDITVDGERLKRSAGTTDRRQAEEYAASLASGLWRAKRLGETPAVAWDTAVLAWLGENAHLRSIEDIKLRLRWLTERLTGRPLATITDDVIRALASERKLQPVNNRAMAAATSAGSAPPAPKQSSNATVNRHLAELSKILHYAHGRKWLPALPPIAKMHEPAKRVAWLTREQAAALLAELPAHLRAMAAFALSTGLRETNVRLLCWQQVDLERGTAWIYGDQAKGGRDFVVPLNDAAIAVLRGQAGQHKRWVFPVPRWEKKAHPDDAPVQTADAPSGKLSNSAWGKARERAGVPWCKFHDLRHTWASWHVQAGTPLPVLKELGNWATLAMVERYAHLGASHVASWAGNVRGGGTTAEQAFRDAARKKASDRSEASSTPGENLGWLMGLEPTTTGITKRSSVASPSNIKHLRPPKGRKAA